MKVLNFGSLNMDYVYSVNHMVIPGETLASKGMQIFCGGKGLNQSIALAKAGVKVYHAGMIGNDGKMLLDACKLGGVDSRYIKLCPERSGHTIIQVDSRGQNCILLYGGANRNITKEYVDEVLEGFVEDDILLLQNEINLLEYIIDRAYEKGMRIILNPSPYDGALDSCKLEKIFMFLMNEIEGAQITGVEMPEEILERIRKMYPEAMVVLTLGEKGAVCQYKDKRYYQEIYPVKVVDTTAAGDTFTGYFISSYVKGMTVQEGLDFAAKASAIAVSREGATTSIPTREEVLSIKF